MFRITRVAVLLWAAMSVNAEANVRVESVTTPGGQRFLFSHMTETSRVVFHVAWPSNRDKESDTNPMVPYLGIRLMTAGGSGGMDASELMERFRDLDASARLWLTSGYIRAFLNVHVDHLDEALKLTRTVRASPRFDERWLVRTREKMHGELKWSRATVASRGWDAVRRAVLGRQPIFESLTLAEFEALERVTREDLLAWHARAFVAEGVQFAVAGNLSRQDAASVVDGVFESLPAGTRQRSIPVEANFAPRRILLHVPDADKSMIGFAGRVPEFVHGGEFEDLIAVRVLAAGEQSRIFDAIRTKLRASYAFGAHLDGYSETVRFLAIGAEVDGGKLAVSRDVVLETYRRFREEGPSVAEVEAIKAQIRQSLRANLRKPGVVANSMMTAMLNGTDAHRVSRYEDELEATTAQTIRERLQIAFPAPEGLIQVIVTPDESVVEGACVVRTIAEVDGCPVMN